MKVPPRERFHAVAGVYARFRPEYPAAILDRVVEAAGLRAPGSASLAVDLGCGTGICARAFASRGLRVIGIDPSGPMLEEARAAGGGVDYREGTAEATGLPGGCAALVTAAQCFHWFDFEGAVAEVRRVLRPGGWCAAFWNHRTPGNPLNDGYEALLQRYSAEYRELFGGKGHALDRLRTLAGVGERLELRADHGQLLDEESFVGMTRSASYVAHGVADLEGFEGELRALFRAHAGDGLVRRALRCEGVALRWA